MKTSQTQEINEYSEPFAAGKNWGQELRRLGWLSAAIPVLLAMACLLCAGRASALTLNWDAGSGGTNTGGTIVTGSGVWDIATSNWDNGTGDQPWTQASTTSGTNTAIFGGVDGNYLITNAVQVAATNIFINNSGYTFVGSPIYLNASGLLAVAAGKSVTFSNNFASGNNAEFYWGNSGATITVNGNFSGQQPRFSGPTNCTYMFGGINAPSVLYVLAPVFQTNGSLTTSASFFIGYPGGAIQGTNYTTGALTLSGGASATQNGGNMVVGRGGGVGTLTVLNGTVNVGISGSTARTIAICNDGNGSERGTVNVFGGTVNMGVVNSPSLNGPIALDPAGSVAGEVAILNQTGGVINAWGGIEFGASTGTFSGGSAMVTNSGGLLYIGTGGIFRGAVFPPTNSITLSGGTLGAFANWSSSFPMTLGTLNGNITFQCADNGNSPFNITLSGPLTGAGGLNVAGGGTLTLSGSNTYSGSTVISNGTLAVITAALPTNGPVTVSALTGSPNLTVQVSNPGQYWSIGPLGFTSGPGTLGFQFGALSPSTTVAPIQVGGGVSFDSGATPTLNLSGSAIAEGTYPLIKYTGAVSGAAPTTANVNLSGGSASAYVTNIAAIKTIAVVVTSSTYNPALSWAVGNGVWDINTTANWDQFGSPVKYTDGSAVIFDDTASGTSPIAITLNTIVNPSGVTANNNAKNYIISGTGSIEGTAGLSMLGAGALTLNGTNAYSGGTVLTQGQLNINNGGDSSDQNSAIGTGPLTINPGIAIDNTSGTDVTLQPFIFENWNGNFTYVGSANSFNTGPGAVTMNAGVTISVNSNNFIVGGAVGDNGAGLKLTKAGNGTLTLLGSGNSYSGGLELLAGQLDFGDQGSAGSGLFTIDGGSIDNISGADLTLNAGSYIWNGSFSYTGASTNILDLGSGPVVQVATLTVTVVSNTLEWDQNIQSGNQLITKGGQGTLIIGGNSTTANQLGMAVIGGTVDLARSSGFAIANTGGAARGLIVESNSLVLDMGNNNQQLGHGANVPLTLETGGIFDLNGNNEFVDSLIMNGGVLQNENTNGSQASLGIVYAGGVATLQGANNQFNVGLDATMAINALITGSGTLTMNGPGDLILSSNETYTGSTLISNGTLTLVDASSISNSVSFTLATTNAVLDMSQNTDTSGNPTPLLTLQSGQTLSGIGEVNGSLTTLGGSLVMPGSGSAIGTLTVSGDTVLGGGLLLSVNRNGGSPQTSQLAVEGAVAYGGTLIVSNIGAILQPGDKFQIFPAANTGFAAINLATTDANNATYSWNNNIANDGSITVATVSTVNPRPGTIQISLSGNNLNLGWPTNAGWLLQAQTNSLATGLSGNGNWITLTGSGSQTNMIVPISSTNGSVYYRMVHP